MYKTFYLTRNLFPRLNITLIGVNNKTRILNYPICFGEWKISNSDDKIISFLNNPIVANNSTVINKVCLLGISDAYIKIDDMNKIHVKLNSNKPYLITKLNDNLDEITFFKIS